MFENVGGKLKSLAKIFFWLTAIICVILAFALGIHTEEVWVSGWRSGHYETQTTVTGAFYYLFFGGPIIAYIYALVFYAFGELVDRATSIDKKIAGEETPTEEKPAEEKPAEETKTEEAPVEAE